MFEYPACRSFSSVVSLPPPSFSVEQHQEVALREKMQGLMQQMSNMRQERDLIQNHQKKISQTIEVIGEDLKDVQQMQSLLENECKGVEQNSFMVRESQAIIYSKRAVSVFKEKKVHQEMNVIQEDQQLLHLKLNRINEKREDIQLKVTTIREKGEIIAQDLSVATQIDKKIEQKAIAIEKSQEQAEKKVREIFRTCRDLQEKVSLFQQERKAHSIPNHLDSAAKEESEGEHAHGLWSLLSKISMVWSLAIKSLAYGWNSVKEYGKSWLIDDHRWERITDILNRPLTRILLGIGIMIIFKST